MPSINRRILFISRTLEKNTNEYKRKERNTNTCSKCDGAGGGEEEVPEGVWRGACWAEQLFCFVRVAWGIHLIAKLKRNNKQQNLQR